MSKWMISFFVCCLVGFAGRLSMAQVVNEDQHFLGASQSVSKKISMDFKGASLIDVLKIFSKQSGFNFIASQDVGDKKINLFLDNIPIDEALEQIFRSYNLEYDNQEGSNVYFVHTKVNSDDELTTRVYVLKNASVSSAKILSASSGSSLTSSPTTTSSSSSSKTSGMVAALKAVLSDKGAVVEDQRTNSLVITDQKSRFPLIEETIAKLDVPVPQILIEVEMLDISKGTSEKMGVKWGESIFQFTGASKYSLLPFNQTDILKDGKAILSPDPEKAPYAYKNGENGPGNLDFTGMTALVQFLKSQTDTRSLARPRILTLNNQTAEIKISTNEAIGVNETTTTGSSTSTTLTVERVQTGVFLSVTPQANLLTEEILMSIHPYVIQARDGLTELGKTYKDPEERGTQSLLRVKNGNTVIIGGLLRKDDSNTVTKVPFLGDIPFVGGAFRHKQKVGTDRELIIFLTPHIITSDNKDKYVIKNAQTIQDWAVESDERGDLIDKHMSSLEQKRF